MVHLPAGDAAGGVGELGISDAGLDVCDAVFQVDLQDPVHAAGGDDDAGMPAVVEGDASAGQAGAAAARDDGDVMLGEEADDGLDVLWRVAEDHGGRAVAGEGEAVGLEDGHLCGIVQNGAGGEQLPEPCEEVRRKGQLRRRRRGDGVDGGRCKDRHERFILRCPGAAGGWAGGRCDRRCMRSCDRRAHAAQCPARKFISFQQQEQLYG